MKNNMIDSDRIDMFDIMIEAFGLYVNDKIAIKTKVELFNILTFIKDKIENNEQDIFYDKLLLMKKVVDNIKFNY